jgi:hypothetical protein
VRMSSRRPRRLAILAGVLLLSLLVADPSVQAACVADGGKGRIAGVSIANRFTSRPPSSFVPDFRRFRSFGANVVGIDVWWYLNSPRDSKPKRGPLTPTDIELERTIAAARSEGLMVSLTLKIATNGEGGEAWRGNWIPPDPGEFFSSWQHTVAHYAKLAERSKVWLFYIASEMDALQSHEAGWRRIIATAREHYSRRLSFQSNWPVAHKVPFWDALDYVSLSAYMPISDRERPTVGELKWGWHDYYGRRWVEHLAALAAHTGKRIVFGEVGYHAAPYPGLRPYASRPQGSGYAPELQANAYQALLEVFEDKPWWAGVIWWAWDPGNQRSFDNNVTESLLRRWYVDGWRPGGQHASTVPDVPAAWPARDAMPAACR